jgi:uncharacterized membrane protein YcaP (DUF421 family)
MEPSLRAVAIYGVLLALFRLTGKRSLSQTTTFDLVLLLIISEAIQNGMVGPGYSVTNAFVLVLTLVLIDLTLDAVKRRSPALERWLEGAPLILVDHGRPLAERLRSTGVDVTDVLAAARRLHGLERMEQIKYAVLERNGELSIVPWDRGEPGVHDQPRAA